MTIWLINHYAVPPSLYPLARTANFAKYLMRAGHKVTIFAASMVHNSNVNLITDKSPYREEIVDGMHYVYIRTCPYSGNGFKRILNMFQFALRLKRVCRHFQRPDAILASSATPLACMAGLKLAKRYQCRGVAEISDLWPESFVAYGLMCKRSPLLIPMYQFEKRIYQKADAIIFTMEGGGRYIKDKGWDKLSGGGIDLSKVHYINNGVDLEVFDYNQRHFEVTDSDLDDKSVFKVVYSGSIRAVNALGTIVEAAEILQKKGEAHIRFILYGDGCDREALIKRCEQKCLHNIVFKGFIDKKYIPNILTKSDLNIIHVNATPITQYGLSLNKLFEYLAAGNPILSDIKTNYDLLERYGAGIVIASQKPEEVAEAIETIAKASPEHRRRMSENARIAAADYDFKLLTDKLIAILMNNAHLAGEDEKAAL